MPTITRTGLPGRLKFGHKLVDLRAVKQRRDLYRA
jgi:hypothetical protein